MQVCHFFNGRREREFSAPSKLHISEKRQKIHCAHELIGPIQHVMGFPSCPISLLVCYRCWEVVHINSEIGRIWERVVGRIGFRTMTPYSPEGFITMTEGLNALSTAAALIWACVVLELTRLTLEKEFTIKTDTSNIKAKL